MRDRILRARLHGALAAAMLTPVAIACGGATSSIPEDGGTDAASGSSSGSGSGSGGSSSGTGSSSGSSSGGSSSSGSSSGTGSSSGSSSGGPHDAGCGAGDHLDDGGICLYYVVPPCGYDGGTINAGDCATLCKSQSPLSCYGTTYEGQEAIGCSTCVTGRRPARMHGVAARDGSAGDFLARCSWLEGAAVHAFRRLARELDAHGAPRRLARRARTAARDEVRHARETASLARALGGSPRRPPRRALPVRGLEAVARENAVEGCVRETYGALVAMWQAGRASDPRVARALARIARDETRHASIGWQIAEWAETRLSPAARDRVREARLAALAVLRAEIAAEPLREVVDRVGVPTAAQAACLLDALERHVVGA